MDAYERAIDREGGLEKVCQIFGWQGGTVHQVRTEIDRRLSIDGIWYDKARDVFITLQVK